MGLEAIGQAVGNLEVKKLKKHRRPRAGTCSPLKSIVVSAYRSTVTLTFLVP